MSSADPIDATSTTPPRGESLRRSHADPALRDGDVRSEKPQADPQDRNTDRKPPENDQVQQGPGGIKGAFRKHPVAMAVCLGLIVVGSIAGIAWYLHARHYESTDDAFIDGRPVLISPQVSGSLISVDVTDNQIVKKGDLLATIDARNYKASADQADAQIRQNEAALKNYEAQIAAQRAQVDQATQQVTEAQAALKFATSANKPTSPISSAFGIIPEA